MEVAAQWFVGAGLLAIFMAVILPLAIWLSGRALDKSP